MPLVTDEAIVLRCSDFSETSQVVTLFSARHGLLRLLAKGIRRSTRERILPGIDVLERGDIAFRPAKPDVGLGMLTEWAQRATPATLARSLDTLYAGLYAAEVTPALTEAYDPHEGLYAGLDALLTSLTGIAERNSGSADQGEALSALLRFQAELLRAIGLAPNLRSCGLCGRELAPAKRRYFSPAAGGALCERCAAQRHDVYGLRPGLRDGSRKEESLGDWFALLDLHLGYQMRRRTRCGAALITRWAVRRPKPIDDKIARANEIRRL